MSNKALVIGIILLGVGGVGLGVYNLLSKPKIAYVRAHDLVSQYEGMKEATIQFDKKKSEWQMDVDTLTAALQHSINGYNQRSKTMRPSERVEMEDYLTAKKQQLMNYSDAIGQKVEEENEKMMQGVLGQVNSFVEQYGKKNGYDIILGTTLSGNLLYAQQYLDITDDVVKELNANYKGKGAN
jgi:outer membrane protein